MQSCISLELMKEMLDRLYFKVNRKVISATEILSIDLCHHCGGTSDCSNIDLDSCFRMPHIMSCFVHLCVWCAFLKFILRYLQYTVLSEFFTWLNLFGRSMEWLKQVAAVHLKVVQYKKQLIIMGHWLNVSLKTPKYQHWLPIKYPEVRVMLSAYTPCITSLCDLAGRTVC